MSMWSSSAGDFGMTSMEADPDPDRCLHCGAEIDHYLGCPDMEADPDPDRCLHCGAEIDHYLGCPDDPDPDYEAEAELRSDDE